MKNTILTIAYISCILLNFNLLSNTDYLLPKPKIIQYNDDKPFVLDCFQLIDSTHNEMLSRFDRDNCQNIDNNSSKIIITRQVSDIEGSYDYQLYGYDNEAYRISITNDSILIEYIDYIGVTRAAQTLMQLVETDNRGRKTIPASTIVDWPAFKLRGFMHDVGRSFIPIEELKKQIDILSHFKINTFHWHLTENQAWRFEVKKYPQLTDPKNMLRHENGYYTQEECMELEQYAWERGITVIPEIDMPGHSAAFKRAMGHSMQTDEGVEELLHILEEVAATFPHSPYIHIGGDEEPITYPDFFKIITDKVHSLSKKVIVWNPIYGYEINSEDGFDMTQMWSTAGKKVDNIPNIDCRYNYINHFDVFADVVGIYKSNIYYSEVGSEEIAGTITAVWNDRKLPTSEDIMMQNNFYANVLASAERAWAGGGNAYIEDSGTTLPCCGDEYDEFADWERRFLHYKNTIISDEPVPYVRQTNIKWRITDAFPNDGDAEKSFPPENHINSISPNQFEYQGNTYNTDIACGGGIYLRHTWGKTVPAHFDDPQINHTAYAWTYIYSPKKQTVGALIEFQNYSRSEIDKVPDNKSWDKKGSRIWMNGNELYPENWSNHNVEINHEIDLKNENFSARNPLLVELKRGWNKVFIKLPYIKAEGVRLNKWMFTFVLTDKNGKNAVDGLIYSPDRKK